MLKPLIYHPSSLRPSLSPLAVQTVLQQLLFLQRAIIESNKPPLAILVQQFVDFVVRGEYARIDEAALSAEYGVNIQNTDNAEAVALAVFADGVSRVMRSGTLDSRRWILRTVAERYWYTASEDSATSALLLRIAVRQLSNFSDAADSFIPSGSDYTSVDPRDADTVARILRYNILVSKHLFRDSSNRRSILKIVIRLFLVPSTSEFACSLIDSWRGDETWLADLRHELGAIIDHGSPEEMTRLLSAIYGGCGAETRLAVASNMLPALFERIVREPFPPSGDFRGLLEGLASNHPQLFFKPLFTCASSAKDHVIVDQLRILAALGHHMPDLLTRDADMTAIALLRSGGGASAKGKAREDAPPSWMIARAGQSILMLELIYKLDTLIDKKGKSSGKSSSAEGPFFHDLENKIAVLVSAREPATLFPFSQRILLNELLYRIRIYTESWHNALWLPSIINWTVQSSLGSTISRMGDPFQNGESPTFQASVTEDVLEEPEKAFEQLATIVHACSITRRDSKHRSVFAISAHETAQAKENSQDWTARLKLLHHFPRVVASASLRLLVAVSSGISEDDFERILPSVWNEYLESDNKRLAAPAGFLIMLCAEKSPSRLKRLIEDDLCGPFTSVRQRALARLVTLFSWRFDISVQKYLSDRRQARPFRGVGKPLSFVATEVGLQRHTNQDEEDSPLLSLGASLPPDIRRGLLELDWYRSETEKSADKKLKWDRLPISTLAMPTMNLIDYERLVETGSVSNSGATSPGLSSPGGMLSRKMSSGGSAGPKRRSVFVNTVASLVANLSSAMWDSDPLIAMLSRDILSAALRDDPSVFTRPLLDALEDPFAVASAEAATRLDSFTIIHANLPPTLSYHVFNYLGGFLKAASRDVMTSPTSLALFASVMPNIARLASHVSDLSVRDLKRNKLESFILPTLDLWFPSIVSSVQLPSGPTPGDPRKTEEQLIAILTIRSAQNLFLANFLKRYPKEAPTVRRGLSPLQLPLKIGHPVDVAQCVMRHVSTLDSPIIAVKSLNLAKSYLILVIQLFRSYNTMTSDRGELSNLLDGINLIMLVHGRDLGLLGMALSAYLTACTRFRRLFISSSGYGVIMPPILRVYSDSFEDGDVRAAIQYTVHRFLALHDKSFVFQALDAASQMAAHPFLVASPEDRRIFCKHTYELFASLHHAYRPETPDTAGLRSDALYQEKEALLTLLAEPLDIRTTSRSRVPSEDAASAIPNLAGSIERTNSVRFVLDDLVRLFLTIIAHAPGSKRAECFLKLLDSWEPYLYEGSASSRMVLQNGIEALGSVILARNLNAKENTNSSTTFAQPESVAGLTEAASSFVESNPMVMRHDYLHLVAEFNNSGGQLSFSALQRTLETIKVLIRDQGGRYSNVVSAFILAATTRLLKPKRGQADDRASRQVVTFLAEVGQLFRAHGDVLNIAPVVEQVTGLLKDSTFTRDREVTQMVVDQFCRPALEACSAAAASHGLATWPARDAVASLFAAALSLPETSAIHLVLQQPPIAAYLAGFLLPLCRVLPITTDAPPNMKPTPRAKSLLPSVWRRLFGFVVEICRKFATGGPMRSNSLEEPEKEKEKEKKRQRQDSPREKLATISISLQIMKTMVIRASEDLEAALPSLWSILSRSIIDTLREATLQFANPNFQSPRASPVPSRAASPTPQSTLNRQSLSSDAHAPSFDSMSQQKQIRALDYLLASTVHFIVIYRSPLILQLRLWIQEHVISVSPTQTARASRLLTPSPSIKISPAFDFASPGRDSRRVSTMFTKLRPRTSAYSPQPSPHLAPQTLIPGLPDPFDSERRAGFQMSPSLSLDVRSASRPIVHLGPVTVHDGLTSPLGPPSEEFEASFRANKRSATLTRADLIQGAHQNTQAVLAWFGYANEEAIVVKAWSRLDALRAVRDETRSLLLEFHESFYFTAATFSHDRDDDDD
ncbi:hypothetical protein DL93DRAFT_1297134 [Clavulina sp. PMI_390]|nr:hypothetical protein DL93DRAFT_1297134 [Clavulina sp. PMI_390]